ncbi:MAG TPA: hypothetical protein VFN75_08920, partial [Pseudonocardiaceae bacterium]|nr:hypothetical protein [Pseudonocardiaceae bacterium]
DQVGAVRLAHRHAGAAAGSATSSAKPYPCSHVREVFAVNYPVPPRMPCWPPMTEEPNKLLAKLDETRIALEVAERHIRLSRSNSKRHAASHMPSYLAHEALSEAGKAIDCIAELLRREIAATSTRTTPDHSVPNAITSCHRGHARADGVADHPELGEEPT